jgi:hypothetical protein
MSSADTRVTSWAQRTGRLRARAWLTLRRELSIDGTDQRGRDRDHILRFESRRTRDERCHHAIDPFDALVSHRSVLLFGVLLRTYSFARNALRL